MRHLLSSAQVDGGTRTARERSALSLATRVFAPLWIFASVAWLGFYWLEDLGLALLALLATALGGFATAAMMCEERRAAP